MIGFCDSDSIYDDKNILKFISIDDFHNRYLNSVSNVKKVGLYKTNGTCIMIKEK